MIRLFIYDKETGALISEFFGEAKYVIHDMLSDQDFTLTPPPDYAQPWYWIDDKWTTEQPS